MQNIFFYNIFPKDILFPLKNINLENHLRDNKSIWKLLFKNTKFYYFNTFIDEMTSYCLF